MSEADAAQRPSDWDPVDEDFPDGLRGPAWVAELERLRGECPVAYSDRFGGFWTLTRYSDVVRAAVDHKTFRSGQQFVRMPDLLTIPGMLNPPEHATYRRMLNKFFTDERVAMLRPRIADLVTEHLDPILQRGSGDAVGEFCLPVAARALAALLNLGDDAYLELLENFARLDETSWDPEAINAAIFAVFSQSVRRVLAERRRAPLDPDQDLISAAMMMEIDGVAASDEVIVAVGVSVIGAGHSTTADALSSVIFRLATDPYLQTRLRRAPALIPEAVEEFLRLDAPLPELTRTTATEVEIGGVTIPAGQLVALNFGAANLDPEAFPHPSACIIDRESRRHLSFGHGVHKCVGAPLARLELVSAVDALLSRTQSIALDGATENSVGLVLKGFAKLPIRVIPA
jgi:cytochrome P450